MPITQDHMEEVVKAGRSCLTAYKLLVEKIEETYKAFTAGQMEADRALHELSAAAFHTRPSVDAPEILATEEQRIKYTKHRNFRAKIRNRAKRAGFSTKGPEFQNFVAGSKHSHSETYPEAASRVPEVLTAQEEPKDANRLQAAIADVLPAAMDSKTLGSTVIFEPDPEAAQPEDFTKGGLKL